LYGRCVFRNCGQHTAGFLKPRKEITSSFCEVYQAIELRDPCYQFVNYQFQNLHPVIRLGLFVFGLVFRGQNLILRSSVRDQIASWQNSRINVLRDFVFFYESLSVLYIFEKKTSA
jgi:hypothetical protein